MADTNYVQLRVAVDGTGEAPAVNLSGVTALEGPQCVLRWEPNEAPLDGFRLVRRKYHFSADVNDGFLVFSSVGSPSVNEFADTLVCHEELYYYTAFYRLDSEWFVPENGQVAVFSGTKLDFVDEYEDAEPGEASVVKRTTWSSGGAWMRKGDTRIRPDKFATPAAAGDWVRVGNDRDGFIAKVRQAGFGYADLEYKLEEWRPSELVPAAVTGVSLTFTKTNASYGNKSTIARATGSFIDDGFTDGMPFVIDGSTLQPRELKYITTVYAGVLKLGTAALVDEAATTAASIRVPPVRLVGDVITILKPKGSYLARRVYEDFLPENFMQEDYALGQTHVLTETTLDNDEVANLGSPGVQYGLERFIAALSAMFARIHGASNYLPTYRDLQKAPLTYVRYFAERYGLILPDEITDSFFIRALVQAQPGVARSRGQLDLFKTWCRIITGQTPQVVLGKDRVIRFDDLDTGFGYDGWEDVVATAAPNIISIAGTISINQLGFLVGGKVECPAISAGELFNVTLVDFQDVYAESSAGVGIVAALGDITGEQVVFTLPAGSGLSGPDATVPGFYDAAVTDGVGSFFSDRGVAAYLPAALTTSETDLLEWVAKDMCPETVSLLVFAALTLTADVS